MTKYLPLFVFLPLAAAGCAAEPDPVPAPDPAGLERFYASLEADTAAAADPLAEKLAPADRLSGAIEKLPAEKIDPKLVARVIAK